MRRRLQKGFLIETVKTNIMLNLRLSSLWLAKGMFLKETLQEWGQAYLWTLGGFELACHDKPGPASWNTTLLIWIAGALQNIISFKIRSFSRLPATNSGSLVMRPFTPFGAPSVLPLYSLRCPPLHPRALSVLPLKRLCSLSRPGTVMSNPKFGVYIVYIYVGMDDAMML